MECHEGLHACIYKGVEVQRVKKVNAKSCVCVCARERDRERESWNIKSKETNSNLETLNQRKQRPVLKH